MMLFCGALLATLPLKAETMYDGHLWTWELFDKDARLMSVSELDGSPISGSIIVPDYFYDSENYDGSYPLKIICESAFYDCREMTSVKIPNSVIEIWDYAFAYCSSLTSVTIPDSVTYIGSYVFEGCSSLTSIVMEGDCNIDDYLIDRAFSGVPASCVVYVPEGNDTYVGPDGKWHGMTVKYYKPGYTYTTDVPVPYEWIKRYYTDYDIDYEAIANATAANGQKVWTCYALGINPMDPSDDFRITKFWMDGNKPMFEYNHTTDGDGKSFEGYIKKLGKVKMTDTWQSVPDDGNPDFRFFTAEVVFSGNNPIDNNPIDDTTIDNLSDKVQLWENGPYWAATNIGAETPEDSGYYFWWDDTVGYKREGDAWVASDGSSDFPFPIDNTLTYGTTLTYTVITPSTFERYGWVIQEDGMYMPAPEHDAAQVQWGDGWRMPTNREIAALVNNCDWTWTTTQNGVNGYIVRGRGDYVSNAIFIPAVGYGECAMFFDFGLLGCYWSSSMPSGNLNIYLTFDQSGYSCNDFNIGLFYFYYGCPIRPVQSAE